MPQVQNSNIQFTQDEENLLYYNNEEHFKECNKEMKNTIKEKLYSFELGNLKNLSSFVFILFLIINAQITNKSIPCLYNQIKEVKSEHDNVSSFFNNESSSMKCLILISQILFIILCGCISRLYHKRMSVPEYQDKIFNNKYFFVSSCICSISFTINLYCYNVTKSISSFIGFNDSAIFIFSLISMISTCIFSYKAVITLCHIKSNFYILFKQLCIGVMLLSFLGYVLSSFLISLFTPSDSFELIVYYIIIICMDTNIIVFLFTFSFFILSLRFDIDFIYNTLNYLPDIEYFLNDQVNNCIEFE